MFSPDEVERYARHLVLSGVGGPGQQALKAASVAVVGAGGLGAPVIQYLAAAGVGRLILIDDDDVALSNLQRQTIFSMADLGRPKVEAAKDFVARLNPAVAVEPHRARFCEGTAALLSGADVVADGTDNAAARYAIADGCEMAKIPLVSAAVHGFSGQITTLIPFETGPNGQPNPTYRCLYPAPPPDALTDVCAREGILGAVTGILGTLQAGEVLKLILKIGDPLVGRLLLVDALGAGFETIRYARAPHIS